MQCGNFIRRRDSVAPGDWRVARPELRSFLRASSAILLGVGIARCASAHLGEVAQEEALIGLVLGDADAGFVLRPSDTTMRLRVTTGTPSGAAFAAGEAMGGEEEGAGVWLGEGARDGSFDGELELVVDPLGVISASPMPGPIANESSSVGGSFDMATPSPRKSVGEVVDGWSISVRVRGGPTAAAAAAEAITGSGRMDWWLARSQALSFTSASPWG